ncbi:MAG: pyridoxal phosphate-dependent aminotransferase [Chloroflexota bacterium]
MQLSERMKAISPSPTLAMDAKTKQMISEGIDVINFSVGEPDFDTPQHIKDAAIDAIARGFTKYTAAGGIPDLKQAIVRKFKDENGLDFTPANVVVSVGAKHTLYNAYMALVNPGDEVIIQAPYWVTYPEAVKLAGGVPVIIETDESTGFKMTPEMIKRRLTKKTRVINLNSPSNPTGAVYTPEELKAIADLIVANDLYCISDEIYERLLYGNVKVVSIASFGDAIKERTIIVNGVSKTYAMTGWRIGFCAAPVEAAKAMTSFQGHVTSNPASISQKAAVAGLNGPRTSIDAMVAEFHRRRDYMYERLTKMPGMSLRLPDGAFYLFPNVSGLLGKTIGGERVTDSDRLCEIILEQGRVACVGGSGFGAPNNIRFSYATSMEKIKEGMDRLEKLLSQVK